MPYADDFYARHPGVFLRFRDLVDRVPAMLAYLTGGDLLRGVASVLSIGAGDGELELQLAAQRGVSIGVVEPSAPYLETFRARARERGLGHRLGVCVGARFEAVTDEALRDRFDLVLAIHSWYAFGLDEAPLRRALALRAPGGRLLIVLGSGRGPTPALKALGERAAHDVTAEQLSAWARERGHEHALDEVPNAIPAASLLSGDVLTDDGRVFVSFLAQCPFAELAPAAQDDARRVLLAHRHGDVIDLGMSCLRFA